MSNSHHRCPAIDCMSRVPHRKCFCDKHWGLVPTSLKVTVASLWDASLPFDEQPEYVREFVTLAVQQIGLVERKVMA